MPTVAELKERARGFEQRGDLATALKIYRHILMHLEGTSGLAGEIPLYVKVGDLAAKLGHSADAIEMYRRAGAHFAAVGTAKSLIALALKVYRVDQGRDDVAGQFAHDLLVHAHDEAAAQVLRDVAERAGLEQMRAALAWVADRAPEETRGVLLRIAEALREGPEVAERAAAEILAPPAETPVEAAPSVEEPAPARDAAPSDAGTNEATPYRDAVGHDAAEAEEEAAPEPELEPQDEPDTDLALEPAQPPVLWTPEELARDEPAPEARRSIETSQPIEDATEPQEADRSSDLEVTSSAELWREAEEQVRPPTPAASRTPAPTPPPEPVAPPPLDPFDVPLQRGASIDVDPVGMEPESAAEPEPEPDREFQPEPMPSARRSAPFPRVLVETETRRRRGRGLAFAAVVVVVAGGAAAIAFDLIPLGETEQPRRRAGAPIAPTTVTPTRPSGTVPLDSGNLRAGDDTTGLAILDTVPATTPGDPTGSGQPGDTAAPVIPTPPVIVPPPVEDPTPRVPTVRVPAGSPLRDALIVVDGLEVQSVTTVPLEGRNGQRVVQQLPSGEPIVLTTAPMSGSDTVGMSEVRITVAGDTTVGSVRYWSFLVTARARAGADTVARLLRQLVRARPVN